MPKSSPPDRWAVGPRFRSLDDAAKRFADPLDNGTYLRNGHAGLERLADRITALEGGTMGVAVSTGQAANALLFSVLLTSGDAVIASRHVFGGTFALLKLLGTQGVKVFWADPAEPTTFESALQEAGESVRLVFTESVSNPDGRVADLDAIAALAHKARVPLAVDNTLGFGACRPIKHGADIVTVSLTKLVAAQNDVMGGMIVDAGTFPHWQAPRFPALSSPQAPGGPSIAEEFGPKAFAVAARKRGSLLGPTLGLRDADLLVRRLAGLKARLSRQEANAKALAKFLSKHPAVKTLRGAGLDADAANTARAQRTMPKARVGTVLLVTLAGGRPALARFFQRLKVITHRANIGQADTLVIEPATTTHRQFGPEERARAGIEDGTVRLSVGIEPLATLIKDLSQALAEPTPARRRAAPPKAKASR